MPPRTEVCLIPWIKKGHPGSIKVGPGFFLPGPLMNIFKEKEHAKGTGTFEDDSAVDQRLGRIPDSHAGNDAA